MNTSAEQLELVFELGSRAADDVAKRVIEALHLSGKSVGLYEKQMTAQAAIDKITEDGKPSFNIETDGAFIHFSTVRAFQLQSLTVGMSESCPLSVWQEIAGPFLGYKGFVQGCLVNSDYSFWQNAADPLQYQAAGRSLAGLPMISNGLPKPLQKLVIDTSVNPGRRTLRVGYIEMVGHVMWFGPRFRALAGISRRQDLLACANLRTSEMRHDILRTIVSESAFVDESSKEAQNSLRRLLFG